MYAKTKNITISIYGLLRANYFAICLTILLLTTVFWSFLGALIQQQNADQLVNVSLFESRTIFSAATLPDAHSFLLKWPLFWIISLLGSSPTVFVLATILICVATVAGLAYLLAKIEKRRPVLGLLYLSLSSMLLLVPIQPTAGALLPVNMAMLTTRNLEYLVLILGWIFIARASSLKTKYFWFSVVALSLLFASDKLFIYISLGGSLLGWAGSILQKNRPLRDLTFLWLKANILAILLAILIMLLVRRLGLVNFSSLDVGPYALAQGGKNLLQSAIYSGLGLLTNVGANPVYDVVVAKNLLPTFFARLFEPTTLPFMVNFAIAAMGVFAAGKLFFFSFSQSIKKAVFVKLALMLILSSISAVLIFVATNHYYAVDARYLGLFMFAVIICLAVYLSKLNIFSKKVLRLLTAILFISIILGILFSYGAYQSSRVALLDINSRNHNIAKELKKHSVKLLIGDYWRVEPIKNISANKLRIRPLDGCTSDRKVLNSPATSAGSQNARTAYLLTLESSSTGFPGCSLDLITAKYGLPSSSQVIAGSLLKPQEIILFYDKGLNHGLVASTKSKSLLADFSTSNCVGHQALNIVAHTDDDLLFINPDIQADIDRGLCVATIFVTAGDDGSGRPYWSKREQGVMAAYSNMLGDDNLGWQQQSEKLPNGQTVSVAAPIGSRRALLIFLRVPDGNLFGQGFSGNNYASLAKLYEGNIGALKTVDDKTIYTYSQLIEVLKIGINSLKPVIIRTQNKQDGAGPHHDHSDHLATGSFVEKAYLESDRAADLEHYFGYPIRDLTQDVFGDELDRKTATFLRYAKFDSAVCQSVVDCNDQPSYGSYLKNHQHVGVIRN